MRFCDFSKVRKIGKSANFRQGSGVRAIFGSKMGPKIGSTGSNFGVLSLSFRATVPCAIFARALKNWPGPKPFKNWPFLKVSFIRALIEEPVYKWRHL